LRARWAFSSNLQDVGEEAKSVTRQRGQAIELGERNGWHTSAAWLYEDDGVSGKAFNSRTRKGLARFITDISGPTRAPFQAFSALARARKG
jgi:DNA invertase Pin-like site-specific DNA recombinase